jgi:hypothetical protein
MRDKVTKGHLRSLTNGVHQGSRLAIAPDFTLAEEGLDISANCDGCLGQGCCVFNYSLTDGVPLLTTLQVCFPAIRDDCDHNSLMMVKDPGWISFSH